MNAYEWTKNEYVKNAPKYNSADEIISHPCKYRIIEVKKGQKKQTGN
ncbi:MAG: hypothetical protein IKS39_01150 [Clostridia bacterium]|nr:hypothetical protein [Clostridia bacterium]